MTTPTKTDAHCYTAILPDASKESHNAVNHADGKETINQKQVVCFSHSERLNETNRDKLSDYHETNPVRIAERGFSTPVDARWYMGRSSQASVVYCSVWVHGREHDVSGRGSAGGYGYHKSSEAFAQAIDSAGIKLVCNETGKRAYIGGTGDRAVTEAMDAIARAAGYSRNARTIV